MPGEPRGIRFPPAKHRKYTLMAAASHRTFQDMVLHLCELGERALEQQEADRRESERMRRGRK